MVKRMSLSLRVALFTFAVGFLVVGVFDAFRFFSADYLRQTSLSLPYVGMAASMLGFYLMFRARRGLDETYLRSALEGKQSILAAVGIYLATAISIAILGVRVGASNAPEIPLWAVVAVGAAVALSLGNFFLGLVLIVRDLIGKWTGAVAWFAFVWSLGVAVVTGVAVAEQLPTLVHEFFANPLFLVVSYIPLAFVMTPLFLTFLLLGAVYWVAERNVTRSSQIHRASTPWRRRFTTVQ